MSFQHLKQTVQARFAAMVASGPLFYVEVDRDHIWDVYLNAFAEDVRQGNNCNCCKSFLRQFGGIVAIRPDNTIASLWDIAFNERGDAEDNEYAASVAALRRYVHTLPVAGPFFNPFAKCGTNKNADGKRPGVIWEHFFIELPKSMVLPEDKIGPKQAEHRSMQGVFLRGINEIEPSAVATVLDLINQGSIYRGAEFKGTLEGFQAVQSIGRQVPETLRANYAWLGAATLIPTITGIRNSAIGTLLNDLSEGRDLDDAVRAYERVVAPANYQRPKSLITPAMIANAKERLAELGLTGSLKRRLLTERDLSAANSLHVYRPAARSGDVFDELTNAQVVNPRSLVKVDEVSIEQFLEKVLPGATSVKLLVENRLFPNFVSLVGPQNPDDPTMFKWGNNISWSYAGETADSVKQLVKSAGGRIEAALRISLSWLSACDLDLHCQEPGGYEIFFSNKQRLSPTGGMLDVDMNLGHRTSDHPVENIAWERMPTKQGRYRVTVHNYCRRDPGNQNGFEVELEVDGELYHFAFPENGASQAIHNICEFEIGKDGFRLLSEVSKVGGYCSKEKWGLKSGVFVPVRAITLSPNHWTQASGNKHYFFMLEGCRTDEKVRGFYNEFLKPELAADRKVFEVLGSKVEVEAAPGELSGLGFSETIRNHVFAQVEGSFKRTVKINF